MISKHKFCPIARIQLQTVKEVWVNLSLRGVKRRSNLTNWTKGIASSLGPRNDMLGRSLFFGMPNPCSDPYTGINVFYDGCDVSI